MHRPAPYCAVSEKYRMRNEAPCGEGGALPGREALDTWQPLQSSLPFSVLSVLRSSLVGPQLVTSQHSAVPGFFQPALAMTPIPLTAATWGPKDFSLLLFVHPAATYCACACCRCHATALEAALPPRLCSQGVGA